LQLFINTVQNMIYKFMVDFSPVKSLEPPSCSNLSLFSSSKSYGSFFPVSWNDKSAATSMNTFFIFPELFETIVGMFEAS